MAKKIYDVFLSFAEPDRELAKKLHALFSAAKLSCYFAPKDLPKETPEEWQKGILQQGLKQSRCFVPVFTRQSLIRRWVLFEAGAAAAHNLKFLVTHVNGVDAQEISQFPYTQHLFHFKLYVEENLRDLLLNVYKEKHGQNQNEESFRQQLDHVFSQRQKLVQAVICRAKRRWIFIAGNTPTQVAPKSVNTKDIPKFVRRLSSKLMDHGFNLSACPQVKSVGKIVLDTAEKKISQQSVCALTGCDVDYEIAGIYPIDREVRLSTAANRIRTRWMEHLLEFRKSYLVNKDWLILIGGNNGTLEEFEAAQQLNAETSQCLRVCFVRCFGGSAARLNRKLKSLPNSELYYNGCEGWRRSDGINALVDNVVKIIEGN